MLQLGDSGNHQRVQPQWAPGLLACFPEILLFVTGFCFLSCPYSHCDSRQSLRCDGHVSFLGAFACVFFGGFCRYVYECVLSPLSSHIKQQVIQVFDLLPLPTTCQPSSSSACFGFLLSASSALLYVNLLLIRRGKCEYD